MFAEQQAGRRTVQAAALRRGIAGSGGGKEGVEHSGLLHLLLLAVALAPHAAAAGAVALVAAVLHAVAAIA
jgi:hypothetical protein